MKNEKLVGDNIIYIFVVLNELGNPQYHIIPSKIVAEYITNSHRNWLNTPGKKGHKHKDTAMRQFFDEDNKYLNRWDLLE